MTKKKSVITAEMIISAIPVHADKPPNYDPEDALKRFVTHLIEAADTALKSERLSEADADLVRYAVCELKRAFPMLMQMVDVFKTGLKVDGTPELSKFVVACLFDVLAAVNLLGSHGVVSQGANEQIRDDIDRERGARAREGRRVKAQPKEDVIRRALEEISGPDKKRLHEINQRLKANGHKTISMSTLTRHKANLRSS